MLIRGQAFKHWCYRQTGADPVTERDASALLRALFSARRLRDYRAHIDRHPAVAGLAQTLRIDLGAPLPDADPLGDLQTLWLVEHANRRVAVYGRRRSDAPHDPWGALLTDAPVFQGDSPWLARLAETAARRVLRYSPAVPGHNTPERQRNLELLTRVESTLLRDAIAQFVGGLEPSLVAGLQASGGATPEAFNVYWGEHGTLDQRRLQALLAFPFFGESLRGDARLYAAVDGGEPLVRVLADHHRVRPRTIQGFRMAPAGLIPPDRRAALLARADALPAEYLPKTAEDWRTFLALAEPLGDLAALTGSDPGPFLGVFAQGWARGHAALSEALGAPFEVGQIHTMMRATWHYGVAPALAAANGPDDTEATPFEAPPADFYRLWFGNRGLARLTALARDWRVGYREFSLMRLTADPNLGTPIEWPPLVPGAQSHTRDGYRVIELTNQEALELEGREQHHCVGSYGARCLDGTASLFSLRDRRTGAILSTFEITLDGPRPAISRHHAQDNAPVDPPLAELARRFLARVVAPLPAGHIAAVRKARQAVGERVFRFLPEPNSGEEPLSAEEWARLAELVAPAHPRGARRQGPAAFYTQGRDGQSEQPMGRRRPLGAGPFAPEGPHRDHPGP